ncbi:hypothetical protein D3C73_1488000 [compost metagenome]
MGDCMYPDCKAVATETWALVPVCQDHHGEIEKETKHYYQKRIAYDARIAYKRIIPLIPWARKE